MKVPLNMCGDYRGTSLKECCAVEEMILMLNSKWLPGNCDVFEWSLLVLHPSIYILFYLKFYI